MPDHTNIRLVLFYICNFCASARKELQSNSLVFMVYYLGMKKMELIAPCHFGLEAVLKKEIIDLGYDITEVSDGRITFAGDADAVCRANIGLRTAERILIKVGSFHAESFEELYQGVKELPWEEFIPERGKFWVKKALRVNSLALLIFSQLRKKL